MGKFMTHKITSRASRRVSAGRKGVRHISRCTALGGGNGMRCILDKHGTTVQHRFSGNPRH